MKLTVRPIVLLTCVLGACAASGSPALQAPDAVGQATSDGRAPREPDGQDSRERSAEGEAVARHFLGDRPGGAWKAGAYQWLTAGRLYWVMGPLEPTRLVAVVDGGRPPILLTGDIVALKRFLAMQFNGRLPGGAALNGIARLIKDAVVGRGGSIATPDLFEKERDDLGEWLKGRERDPAEFKKLCSGIRGSVAKNEWTVEFNVINGWGGVDVVRASGTASPLTLQHVSVGLVKARGEFRYPLEG
jgi:hypothetical protein